MMAARDVKARLPRGRIILDALALVAVLFPYGALAQQPQCDERTKVLSHLAEKYKEAPVAAGITNSGGLVEVLSDGKGGTWTIIVTTPQGMSCLVAAGEGWRALIYKLDGPEA